MMRVTRVLWRARFARVAVPPPRRRYYYRSTIQSNNTPNSGTSFSSPSGLTIENTETPFRQNFSRDIFSGSGSLVVRLVNSEKIEEAYDAFQQDPDSAGAAKLISAYTTAANIRDFEKPFEIYNKIRSITMPSLSVYRSILKFFTMHKIDNAQAVELLNHIYAEGDNGILSSDEPSIYTSLTTLSRLVTHLDIARAVFLKIKNKSISFAPSVIDYTKLVQTFSVALKLNEALEVFNEMQAQNTPPNEITYSALLFCCGEMKDEKQALELLKHFSKSGLEVTPIVASTIVTMYAKFGRAALALKFFNKLPLKEMTTYNNMMRVCLECKMPEVVEGLYNQLIAKFRPSYRSYKYMITACGLLKNYPLGRSLHAEVVDRNLVSDDNGVVEALIQMYGRCGALKDAKSTFQRVLRKSSGSYAAIIEALAPQGTSDDVLHLYKEMGVAGLIPDGATFLNLLKVCSRKGLVEEGKTLFNDMKLKNVPQTMDHYQSMVELLAGRGRLDEAEKFIREMPIPATAAVWRQLLAKCKTYQDVKRAEEVFTILQGMGEVDSELESLMETIRAGAQSSSEQMDKVLETPTEKILDHEQVAITLVDDSSFFDKPIQHKPSQDNTEIIED